MKRSIFLLTLFLSLSTLAQNTIKGKIVIEGSNTALAASSIFLNNTSIGTVSAPDGCFELINIPEGKYDLIVSNVGFETIVYSFETKMLPLNFKFEMKSKDVVLENVTVGGYTTETWEKWGELFLEKFLGTSENSKRCKIINQKAIHFRFYKKQNKLEVIADEPLIIDNRALGYIIQYQLEHFYIDFKEHSSYFDGYVLFKERRKSPGKSSLKGRQHVYYSSMMHFMRSVYNNTIAQEGFVVRRMQRIYNTERERIRNLYRSKAIISDGLIRAGMPRVTIPKDSAAYYDKVLNQKEYEDVYSNCTLTADSIIEKKDGQYKLITWNNYLAATYLKGSEEKAYLEYIKETRKPIPPFSLLLLRFDRKIIIDANGNWFPPENIAALSYWGWSEKVGNMLPLDYEPGKK